MMLWGSFLSLSSSFRLVPPLFSLFSQSHCIFPRGIRDVGGRSSCFFLHMANESAAPLPAGRCETTEEKTKVENRIRRKGLFSGKNCFRA